MKNFVALGDSMEITAPAALLSGQGVLIDSLFGIAQTNIANGERGIITLNGVYDLPKVASQAWSVGAKIYWNNTVKVTTNVGTNNSLIGVAVLAVGGTPGEVIGRVRLNGVSVV